MENYVNNFKNKTANNIVKKFFGKLLLILFFLSSWPTVFTMLVYAETMQSNEYTATIEDKESDKKEKDFSKLSPKETKKRIKSLEAKIDRLIKEKKILYLNMHKVRVKLLKTDPELKKLHKKIMELYKQLGIMIDNKKPMQNLIKEEKNINRKIENLSERIEKMKRELREASDEQNNKNI